MQVIKHYSKKMKLGQHFSAHGKLKQVLKWNPNYVQLNKTIQIKSTIDWKRTISESRVRTHWVQLRKVATPMTTEVRIDA